MISKKCSPRINTVSHTVLHDFKTDATLLTLSHDAADAVVSLAFRTDGESTLVSGGASGTLHVWDLEKRARRACVPCAHTPGAVCALHFIRAKPELLSAAKIREHI